MIDYSKMTFDEEHDILVEILKEEPISNILLIDDIYSTLREEYNNEILSRWEKKQYLHGRACE